MPRIQARFDGKCFTCGGTLPKGSEIWYANNRAFHVKCATIDDPSTTDAHQLAAALGYRPHGELEPKGES